MRILICEDNRLVMKTLSLILERDGFTVDLAEDGNVAFEFLKREVYDLFLIDIHLPYHSGLEIISYIRTELKKKTPVLVLSAFSDLKVQQQAGELEIDDYIVKPFNPTELKKRIRSILNMNL
jgi:DNA-binding response OmpR family regulator